MTSKWDFLKPEAVVLTDYYGDLRQVRIMKVEARSDTLTGIMAKTEGCVWLDAAWFKPVVEGDRTNG